MHDFPRGRSVETFERRVGRALDALVPRDAPLLVACSGGPDSSAALIAIALARRGHCEVIAAHFDHGMRPQIEAAADLAAVEALAQRLGIACVHGADASPGRSEASARDARYRWLASACAEAGVVWCATGHTLDDQAETVLLRLTRGAGSAGASGMATAASWPVRCKGGASLRVARPLLDIRRAEAAAYLAALGVEPRLDPSNATTEFQRNRVRHRVLPELRTVNPRAEEALARFATAAREDNDALEAWATAASESLVELDRGGDGTVRGVRVQRAGLRALPPAVSLRILRSAAAHLDVSLEAGQARELLRLAARRGARLGLEGAEVVMAEVHVSFTRRG